MPKIRIHIYCKQIIAPNFTSPQIENFCQQHDIEHIRVKTNSNGLVESHSSMRNKIKAPFVHIMILNVCFLTCMFAEYQWTKA